MCVCLLSQQQQTFKTSKTSCKHRFSFICVCKGTTIFRNCQIKTDLFFLFFRNSLKVREKNLLQLRILPLIFRLLWLQLRILLQIRYKNGQKHRSKQLLLSGWISNPTKNQKPRKSKKKW